MYSGKHHKGTGAKQSRSRDFGPTQAEFIAGQLQTPRATPDEISILIRMKRRISLRWFSFEAEASHRYRPADRRL